MMGVDSVGQDAVLEELLYVLKDLENSIGNDLSELESLKEYCEYRDDLLSLTASDVSLLATYFFNSNEEAQDKFLNLLHKVYNDKTKEENFIKELRNLYLLSRDGLENTTQYGYSKRIIIDFLNVLRDEAIASKKPNTIREKEVAGKFFIVRKLIKYFSAASGSVEIKNIDDFIIMLDTLNVSDEFKNNALSVAIENNAKFYSNSLRHRKKEKKD